MNKTCEERINEHFNGRIADIRKLWEMYINDPEAYDEELGNFQEYGLSLEYVAAGTFNNKRGYFCYLLSWGGPSDEFRFYLDDQKNPYKITYNFMDWFDGAEKELTGTDYDLMDEIYQDFKDCGIVEAEIEKALN